jgi:hypothetical protein
MCSFVDNKSGRADPRPGNVSRAGVRLPSQVLILQQIKRINNIICFVQLSALVSCTHFGLYGVRKVKLKGISGDGSEDDDI